MTRRVYVGASRTGKGLFAARDYAPRQAIVPIEGKVHDWSVLWRRGGAFMDNCFRFGEETYLDPGNGPGRWLNHSCSPNAAVRFDRKTLLLVAARRIRAHQEVVIDYSTILGDDDAWRMYCRCSSAKCRRWISRFGLLPAALRKSYLRRGFVAANILPTLDEYPL